MEANPDAPTLLAGRYAYLRELGQGGSGRVLLVEDRSRSGGEESHRALKVVSGPEAGRLRWEFELLANLSHPHLARVHELLRVDERLGPPFRLAPGAHVLVEQFVNGEPAHLVAHRLEPELRVPWALDVAEKAARAVAAIHAIGLIHGDIKPHNLLVSDDGDAVHLIDLGLARRPGPASRVSGTPAYLAPEGWYGEQSVASDLYGLGATLHELLGGTGPLGQAPSRSAAGLATEALTHPRTPDSLPSGVPPGVRRFLATLLDQDPSRRPASAREVVGRLAALGAEVAGTSRAELAAGLAAESTAEERAMAVTRLPLVGRDEALGTLHSALRGGGLVVLVGSHGAGRGRLLREAVRRLQSERATDGKSVPTYMRYESAPPERARTEGAIIHIERGDSLDEEDVARCLRASLISGGTLVLERSGALEAAQLNLEVGPLAADDMGRLLGLALDEEPGPSSIEASMRSSGGLPGRLCRLLSEAFLAHEDPSRPQTLVRLGEDREASLPVPDAARPLAELLSVAGGRLHAEAVALVLGPREMAYQASLAVAAGLAFVDDSGALRLRTDVANTGLSGLSAEARRSWSQKLARLELNSEQRAFVAAGLAKDSEADKAFLSAMADARERGDPEAAVSLGRRALELLGSDEGGHAALDVSLADALRARGRYEEALERLAGTSNSTALALKAEIERLAGSRDDARAHAQAAAGIEDQAVVRGSAQAILGRILLEEGQAEEALRYVEHALAPALAKEGSPALSGSPAAARLMEVAALCAARCDDLAAAEQWVGRALEECEDPASSARAYAVAAQLALARGEVHAAVAKYVKAFELAEAAGEFHSAAAFLVNVGVARLDAGEIGTAIPDLREGARRLARLGRDQDLARALYNLAVSASLIGDSDMMLSAVRHCREAAERGHDRRAEAFAEMLWAENALFRGALSEAGQRLARAAELVGSEASLADRVIVGARLCLILLAKGDQRAAEGELRALRGDAFDALPALARAEWHTASARVHGRAERAVDGLREGLRAKEAGEAAGTFEARLRASMALADAAELAGDMPMRERSLRDARTLLDRVQRSLPAVQRASFRAVPAYRKAFETQPGEGGPPSGQDRWRRLTVFARRLTAERRLSRLREEIVDAALELSGAERGLLVLRGPTGVLSVPVARTLSSMPGPGPVQYSTSVVSRVIDTGVTVSSVNALNDEQLTAASSVHALALRSLVAVPLRRRGEIVGALYLDDRLRPGAFDREDMEILEDLSGLASIALEGAELLRMERANGRRLGVLKRRLAQTVEAQAHEIASLKKSSSNTVEAVPGIVGHSEAMQRALDMIQRAAPSDIPVLITGESGTGKELFARAVHDLSGRREGPYVSENCGAIPEGLLESTLFGHVRGAFTGADEARRGLFEAANGGTLFLDEIGEMSSAMQAKLLRAVQSGEVRPVGSDESRIVDVRIVAATHRDLGLMLANGTFRQDLYYRLAVLPIRVPSLRDRKEDIAPLVAHFVGKHAPNRQLRLDRPALAAFLSYGWPGNVRQLENEILRALVLADGRICLEHLSAPVRGEADESPPDELDLKGQVHALERRLIKGALAQAGSQTKAAQLLGVSRYGLQKMLKRLDLGT